jgi:hypothetical protein
MEGSEGEENFHTAEARRWLLGPVVALPEHPDQHCSERPVILRVDQELGEGAATDRTRSRRSARRDRGQGSLRTWSGSARGAGRARPDVRVVGHRVHLDASGHPGPSGPLRKSYRSNLQSRNRALYSLSSTGGLSAEESAVPHSLMDISFLGLTSLHLPPNCRQCRRDPDASERAGLLRHRLSSATVAESQSVAPAGTDEETAAVSTELPGLVKPECSEHQRPNPVTCHRPTRR